MRFHPLVSMIVLMSSVGAGETPTPTETFTDICEIAFLNAAGASELLRASDVFTKSTAPLERQFRLQSETKVSEEQLLVFAGEQATDWTDVEIEAMRMVLQDLRSRISDLSLPLPERVAFIKTTGNEEGGAAYCRGHSVIFSAKMLRATPPKLKQLVAHELFHILSRTNPNLRDQLYTIIGFHRCGEVNLPSDLQERRLTNPDAPIHEHFIRVDHDGRTEAAVPITFLFSKKYESGNMFRFLQFRLMLIEEPKADEPARPKLDEGQKPILLDATRLASFAKQIGANTNYIIHPEEIMADNFSAMLADQTDLPDPWIVEAMRKQLLSPRKKTADEDDE